VTLQIANRQAKGCLPGQTIKLKKWTSEPERFNGDPTHHTPGLNTWSWHPLNGVPSSGDPARL
jgi:hypothetical protein